MSTSEVTRSDSNRSDNSQKPRVSFNRDVHIKRIAPHERRSSLDCNTDEDSRGSYKRRVRRKNYKPENGHLEGQSPRKFYSLPRNKSKKFAGDIDTSSLDRKANKRRDYLEFSPPVKPPRIFVASAESLPKPPIRRRQKEKSTPNVKRSVSDVSSLKSKAFGPLKQNENRKPIKKQTETKDSPKEERIVDKLKQYIDEVDQELYEETGIRYKPPMSNKEPTPVVIDVDSAEKISDGKTSKFKHSLGRTFRSLGQKINKLPQAAKNVKNSILKSSKHKNNNLSEPSTLQSRLSVSSPAIQTISEDDKLSNRMYYNSQQPERGSNVKRLIKQLSSDNISQQPPMPKSVLVTPTSYVQHNNNQPFSYFARATSTDTGIDHHTLRKDLTERVNNENLRIKEKSNKNIDTLKESPILPTYRKSTPISHMFDNTIKTEFEEKNNKCLQENNFGGFSKISPEPVAVKSGIRARRDMLEMRNLQRVQGKRNTLGSQILFENCETQTTNKKLGSQYLSTPEISRHEEPKNKFNSLQRNERLPNIPQKSKNKKAVLNPISKTWNHKHDPDLSYSEDEGFVSGNLIYNQNNGNNRLTPSIEKPPIVKEKLSRVYSNSYVPEYNSNTVNNTSTEEETVIDPCGDMKKNKTYFGDTDSDKISINRPRESNMPRSKKSYGASKDKRKYNENQHSLNRSSLDLKQSSDKLGSQQSLSSVVYLHTPAVVDIPKRGSARSKLDYTSGDDISSNISSQITPHIKTTSRSFSILAPWKPNRIKGTMDIDYSQSQNGSLRTSNQSTVSRKSENRKKNGKGFGSNNSKENANKKKGSKSIFRSLSIPREKENSWWFRK